MSEKHVVQERRDYGMQLEVLLSLIYHFIVAEGESVVDGGVASGMHTIPLSRLVGPKGTVYGFEASPPVASWLPSHLAKFNLSPNVKLSSAALGEHSGQAQFVVDLANSGLSHIRRALETEPDRDVSREAVHLVRVVNLDEALSGSDRISFMKLDLEGFDFFALRGARNLLLRDRPIVAFENTGRVAADAYGYAAKEYFDFFDEIGYEVYDLNGLLVTKHNWGSSDLTFEAIGGARNDKRLSKSRILIDGFHASIDGHELIRDWGEASIACLNPLEYLLGLDWRA